METSVVVEELSRFPGEVPWKFAYGTAGFRDKADRLDRVLFRMGLLAALRSKSVGAAIGVAITASHNPVEDNGVKIVDPMGEMLLQEWEGHATRLANVDLSELKEVLEDIVLASGCDITSPSHVIIARDTRPSGERLALHLTKAAELLQSKVTDYGILTTPQLHYIVRCVNTQGKFGEPSEVGYYQKMVTAFNQLLPKPLPPSLRASVKLDGANGVGADKVRRLMKCFGPECVLTVHVLNDGSSGELNHKCGADYVKTGQMAPAGMSYSEGERCVSFDGDADRIVYFYGGECGNFRLLDGDKIAALVAGFICERLQHLQADLTIGVIQTAYSNGSSTAYLKDTLRIPIACTLTGVKHLHHRAKEFDIGVYFEANGHGTVLFSDRASETFKMASEDEGLSGATREAARELLALTRLINQTVGDAIADLLLVEIILLLRKWGSREWDKLYAELPSRQLKVKVRDRSVVETRDFERVCVAPVGLQQEIDQLVQGTPKGRAFVRPSGTEDVVRVYAEAATQESADHLAVQVGVKVHQMADGIGDIPSL